MRNSPPLTAEPLPAGFGGIAKDWVVALVRTTTSCLEGEFLTVAKISIKTLRSGSPREKVAAPARILHPLVRLALRMLDDVEMSHPKRLDDLAKTVKTKIQRDRRSE